MTHARPLHEKNIMVPPYGFYPKMTYIHHARESTITQNFSALRVMVKLDITQNLRILRYVDVGQKKGRQIEKLMTHNAKNGRYSPPC